jgi:hypothetical protein
MLLVSNQERLPYKCCDELLFSYDLLVRARRILRRNGRNNKIWPPASTPWPITLQLQWGQVGE